MIENWMMVRYSERAGNDFEGSVGVGMRMIWKKNDGEDEDGWMEEEDVVKGGCLQLFKCGKQVLTSLLLVEIQQRFGKLAFPLLPASSNLASLCLSVG